MCIKHSSGESACRFLETRALRRGFDGVSNPRQPCERLNSRLYKVAGQQYAVFRAFRRAGIVSEEFHSQGFTRKGVALEMAQLWVNLRAKDKSAKAGYQTCSKRRYPTSHCRETPE